jgi:hypothetical protein
MSSIIKGLVDEQGVEETKKLSAQEKFKRSMKRAGYDMDAGAKRLQDLLAKQKKEREEFEKKEVKEDETLQYAAEVTPKVSPYAGVRDNKFRGAIGEGIKQMFENPNESPTDSGYQQGGWRKMNEEEVDEDLRKWFKEKWVRFGPDGKIRGACARGDDSEGKPKCLPQAKAHALGKKGRKYAAAKKRREDPNPERSGPAKNVATKKKSNEGQGVAEGSGFDQEAGIGLDGESFKFKIKDLVALANNYPVTPIDPRQFTQQIKGRNEDPTQSMARAEKADLQYPIIVVQRTNGKLWIADGTHRAHKAILNKIPKINAKIIPIKDMSPFSVKQGEVEGNLKEFAPNFRDDSDGDSRDIDRLREKIYSLLMKKLANVNGDPQDIAMAAMEVADDIASESELVDFTKLPNWVEMVKNKIKGVVGAQDLEESFDQPYKLKWHVGDMDEIEAYAELPDGNNLNIMFNLDANEEGEEAWAVEFYRNNSQEVTGEGDAQRIFATVLSAIKTFIKKYKPNRITFSASKDNWAKQQQGSYSRVNLYDRLVQRYASTLGYKAFRADTGDKVIYELSKIAKQVAEGSGNWYIRVRGKVLKDKQFNAIPFPSKDEASRKAFEIHNKKRIPIELIKLTQSWMDGPEQGVAEGSGKNVVKSVRVGNFRHDLVDTGVGWQVRIYNGDELYDTGMSKNSEQKGLAALEDAVAYTEKLTRTKRQGVAEGFSDISGLLSASNLNKSFIITAELAEGGKKKFRVKAQNERVAIEKFKKHHSMAKIINVAEEGVEEGSKYPRNPASYHLKKYPVPQDQLARPVKKEPKKPEKKPDEKLDELKCWSGYTRVKGVPAGAPGSCKKKTNEEHQQCPECGGAMYEVSLMNEKKDACYYKVKSRYKVWPSAYASGALVKCRKKGAKNWGSKSKSNEGQIYSTGGGAGQAQRYYTPKDNLGETKSNILSGIFKANK